MRYYKVLVSLLIVPSLIFFSSCRSTNPTNPKPGVISVLVSDNFLGPVENVDITVTPGDLVQSTDNNGTASFEVEPGDYYVDADVCCVGPGWIEYHVPVTVTGNDTVEVKLGACLACV